MLIDIIKKLYPVGSYIAYEVYPINEVHTKVAYVTGHHIGHNMDGEERNVITVRDVLFPNYEHHIYYGLEKFKSLNSKEAIEKAIENEWLGK